MSNGVLYVVPTLGLRPDYLTVCLDSIAGQRGAEVSAVVVAPPSAPPEVRRAAADRGFSYATQTGSGISAAINQGWRLAGEGHAHWAWLGDDDFLLPGSSGRASALLAGDPAAAMVFGQCRYVDEAGELLYRARPSSLAALLLRWGPNLVPQPGSVARADAVRKVGLLDEELRYAMDLDLFLRLKDVGRLRYCPAELAAFRWHAQSTTVAGPESSEKEAAAVRRRTWTGSRRAGPVIAPAAMLVGRALYRAQRGR